MDRALQGLGGAALFGDQAGVLRSLARGFPANQSEPDINRVFVGVLFIAAFAVLVWFLSRLAMRNDKPGSYNNPRSLFRSLCRAHRLDRAERKLLERLAQFRQIKHPAALFLDPRQFETADLTADLRQQADKLRALREVLFARVEDGAAA